MATFFSTILLDGEVLRDVRERLLQLLRCVLDVVALGLVLLEVIQVGERLRQVLRDLVALLHLECDDLDALEVLQILRSRGGLIFARLVPVEQLLALQDLELLRALVVARMLHLAELREPLLLHLAFLQDFKALLLHEFCEIAFLLGFPFPEGLEVLPRPVLARVLARVSARFLLLNLLQVQALTRRLVHA